MPLVPLILALLNAFPALRNLFAQVSEALAKQNEAEAINRKQEKDAAVNKAIDQIIADEKHDPTSH